MKKVYLPVLIAFVSFSCAHAPALRSVGLAGPEASLQAPAVKTAYAFPVAEPFFPVYDLSKLRVGMTKAEVQALFSSPKNTKQTPKDEYWEYAAFELYFRNGRLINWFML